jgi:amino acid transporter
MRPWLRTLAYYSPAIVLVAIAVSAFWMGLYGPTPPPCNCTGPACACPNLTRGPPIWAWTVEVYLTAAGIYTVIMFLVLRRIRRSVHPTT